MSSLLRIVIDCRQEQPAASYFAMGETRVVDSPAGTYREAEAKPLARFGYRFQIRHVGRPHVAIIRYPDDKRRFMIIGDGTCYDLSTGVTTGHAYPISGQMCELRQLFWPRWQDCSLCFMTWGHGEPAAVAGIEIQELPGDALAPLPLSAAAAGAGPGRELGVQYEDPCGTAASEGALDKATWVERVITYLKHSGQGLFMYPLVWYHGPQVPSCEPASYFDWMAGPGRKLYQRWTTQPPDWAAAMLQRFDEEGLDFIASMTLLRLGGLMQKMNTDLAAIQAGADTPNNLLWNDQVQAGTMDWTTLYNVNNFQGVLERREPVYAEVKGYPWAYGEKKPCDLETPYHPGPVFNPLHPEVQQAVIGFIRDFAGRYARFRSFKGVSLNLWAPTLVWFGSLHAGYDDITCRLFEQETGIRIPVGPTDPQRFSKRYEFLTFHCRPAWIAWRCRKVHELIGRIRDALVAVRADLRLIVTAWVEPYVPQFLGNGGAQHQIGARKSTVELYREAGFDPDLYLGEPNLETDLQLDGGGRDRTPGNDAQAPLESFFMFRDHDFLDRATLAAFRHSGAFIFNDWHEAWGEHTWFPCAADDPDQDALAVISGRPAEGICRINSAYPKDGFWWESQLRITPAFPPGPHFLEPYAHALAEFDACRITRGGLFLDKCHTAEIQGFARAFRALPAVRFETVGGKTDPVAVRTLVHAGRRYLYLVNREYYPVAAELLFDRAPGPLTDLASGDVIPGAAHLSLTLAPYELRALVLAPAAAVAEFAAHPPADILAGLAAQAEATLAAIAAASAAGRFVAGAAELAAGLRTAVADGRWSWLRHALTSYPAVKCRS